MAKNYVTIEQKDKKVHQPEQKKRKLSEPSTDQEHPLLNLQQTIGNRGIQRMLLQAKGEAPYELDEDTANRINQEKSGGQPIDSGLKNQMEVMTNQKLGDVQVHTSHEADTLNQQVGAKAFTTGNDIFFSSGSYQPESSAGRELIAHELTHVVQQESGVTSGSQKMTVNAPNDRFEQEADMVSKSFDASTSSSTEKNPPLSDEDYEMVNRQEEDELEEI
jgi:hypothetical protein